MVDMESERKRGGRTRGDMAATELNGDFSGYVTDYRKRFFKKADAIRETSRRAWQNFYVRTK